MRVTVITCDNCFAPIQREEHVRSVLNMEWCPACAEGVSRDLTALPFNEWPRRVLREDVRVVFEARDHRLDRALNDVRVLREEVARLASQIAAARKLAADGYAEGDLAKTLLDIASDARRAASLAEEAIKVTEQ